MKKLSLLLLLPFFMLFACSDDNAESLLDDTSIEVHIEGAEPYLKCIAGYKEGNIFKKLCDIGGISENKPSQNIKIKDGVTEVYIFGEYMLVPSMIEEPFIIIPNKKNIIHIKEKAAKVVVDTTDPQMYPQSN